MDVVQSVNGVPIRLTDERWGHIVGGHPEFQLRREDVVRTVAEPDIVVSGYEDELVAMRRVEWGWIVVPYVEVSETDGFVITAFMTKLGPSPRRSVIWPLT